MERSLFLLKQQFESSSSKTPEFVTFANTFRKELTAELKKLNCTKPKFNVGHFYISGFFTAPSGQVYYFSIQDVRGGNITEMMYRTAKDYKDFTGGVNHWIPLYRVKDMQLI